MDELRNKKVKLRKPRRCWCCAKRFEVGKELTHTVTVDSGQFYSTYWCPVGLNYFTTCDRYELWDGFDYGEIAELIRDRDYRPKETNNDDLPF